MKSTKVVWLVLAAGLVYVAIRAYQTYTVNGGTFTAAKFNTTAAGGGTAAAVG